MGKVYIIGAGPGDPDLATIKCVEILKKADVVIYDHLIPQELLMYAEKAEKIYVGKEAGKHTLSQEKINELLVEKAKEGKNVVRLKGGDPFIFGRGGEECEYLWKNNIDFEVVPGVSSFYSVPAYAGIPITHRDFVSSFAVATGSEAEGRERLDFSALSKCGTLIFLMTVKPLEKIVKKLLENLPPSTPCAVIENGTTPLQRTVISTLDKIVEKAKDEKINPPAIFLVGEVVKLREKINWFEKKVLFQKKIVITRPLKQSYSASKLIREFGGLPILFPSVKIVFGEKHKENIKKFLEEIESKNKEERNDTILVFTSQNGVQNFFSFLFSIGKDSRTIWGMKVAAVGEKTASSLVESGIIPDILPQNFTTENLYEELKIRPEKNVVFLRAEKVKNIEDKLIQSGKNVKTVEIYSIEKEEKTKEEIEELKILNPDVLTFTSSLSFIYFTEFFEKDWIKDRVIACIGEVTAKTVERYVKKPEIVSKKQTIESLVEEIVKFYSK
ncbi:MAG: uroporphyrinogen-III C-methyltransferase [Candidatus Calescibacterium sp.]|jgi:uroporphyrinogen III methyltransferase/synthase|nr:uroporphyrinogen-III C-methyltransferase [Candidatus Calescibacterium sp.]